MSRYLLLFIFNLPFVVAGLLSAITQYKLAKITKARMYSLLALWLIIFAGLALAYPIYRWLFNNQLTDTEPLSLFDVIQITGIVITLFIANRARAQVELLERRVNDLHQELSIILSKKR